MHFLTYNPDGIIVYSGGTMIAIKKNEKIILELEPEEYSEERLIIIEAHTRSKKVKPRMHEVPDWQKTSNRNGGMRYC